MRGVPPASSVWAPPVQNGMPISRRNQWVISRCSLQDRPSPFRSENGQVYSEDGRWSKTPHGQVDFNDLLLSVKAWSHLSFRWAAEKKVKEMAAVIKKQAFQYSNHACYALNDSTKYLLSLGTGQGRGAEQKISVRGVGARTISTALVLVGHGLKSDLRGIN